MRKQGAVVHQTGHRHRHRLQGSKGISLRLWVSEDASNTLRRLARRRGISQAAMLGQLVAEADRPAANDPWMSNFQA